MTKTLRNMVCGLALVCAFTGLAQANRQAARDAFNQGRAAFKAGRYEDAAKMLKKAHRLEPHPALLRYLAQTYVHLGDLKAAKAHFQLYVRQAPNAPDRKKIEAQIVRLRKAIAKKAAKAKKKKRKKRKQVQASDPETATSGVKSNLAPTGDDEEVPDAIGQPTAKAAASRDWSGVYRTAKWTATIAGVGALAAGLVFNLLSANAVSELEGEARSNNVDLKKPTRSYEKKHFDLQQDYKRFNTMAVASYIAGGVLTAVGVTLFAFDRRSGSKRERRVSGARSASVAPVVGPGFYGLSGTVHF